MCIVVMVSHLVRARCPGEARALKHTYAMYLALIHVHIRNAFRAETAMLRAEVHGAIPLCLSYA